MMASSGLDNTSWIIEISANNRYEIPFDRGIYKIAVKSLFFTDHPKEDISYDFAFLGVDYPIVYASNIHLPNKKTFVAICSYPTTSVNKNNKISIDLSDHLTYHTINFQGTSTLSLQIRNLHGEPIKNIKGVIHLLIRPT